VSEGPELTIDACPECRSAVFEGERFCEACGYKLATDVLEPEDPKESGREEPAVSPENKQRIDLEEGSVAAVTDRGWRRQRNEDAVTLAAVGDRSAVAVCDGVASTSNAHRAAQAAGAAAIRALDYALQAPGWPARRELHDLFGEAFEAAQRAVEAATEDRDRTGDLSPSTTLVVALAAPGQVLVGNVGDSRAYWLSESALDRRLLTVDDSWAQDRIAEGVEPQEAFAHPEAHAITRWIGADAESTEPRITDFEVTEPGLLVVCTDGLWNYFEEPAKLAELVAAADDLSPSGIAHYLADAALDAGGQDNITVAVVPVGPAHTPDAPSKE
jgi:serine/threonine protein phosphatase PrpC